jgi:TIR domain
LSVPRIDIDQLLRYAPAGLLGRDDELAMLDDAWGRSERGEPARPRVLSLVAIGGEGKTSLVAHWLTTLAARDWPGCDAVYAWSFYNQGVQGQAAGSSDLFLANALRFFGDPDTADSALGAYEKGKRLARLVAERRVLLVLDGLEPLQYPPSSPTAAQFTDSGLAALLRSLAATNAGLCIATTRQPLADLAAYRQTTAPVHQLSQLSPDAGVALLQALGVCGPEASVRRLVGRMDGHALALTLLGTFLRDAHGGDIDAVDRVRLDEADRYVLNGHTFRAMAAYEEWFTAALPACPPSISPPKNSGAAGLAVLRLVGLFDRPATAGCVAALSAAPAIEGLTEPLIGLTGTGLNLVLRGLEHARLITVQRDRGALIAVDAHPLVREYFALRVRDTSPAAWATAHRRIYDHLTTTTVEGEKPSLNDLQPLYQAVIHGCHANHHQAALDNVLLARIRRGNEAYSIKKLGAFGPDQAVLAGFFTTVWTVPGPDLTPAAQAFVLGVAGFGLQALGRARDALEPLTLGYHRDLDRCDWSNACVAAKNLCGLVVALGDLTTAAEHAAAAIEHADLTTNPFHQITSRAFRADVYWRQGRAGDARAGFLDCATRQTGFQPDEPFLYSLRGFQWCEVLLGDAEHSAWTGVADPGTLTAICDMVTDRANHTLNLGVGNGWLVDIGLDRLTIARSNLYHAILTGTTPNPDTADSAIDTLRHAGLQDYLVSGLLTRAWTREAAIGAHAAVDDLNEAWDIAERGGMRLHLADIHLHRAHLCHTLTPYPWNNPTTDLNDAARLIDDCGYHHRDRHLIHTRALIAARFTSATGSDPIQEAAMPTALISYSHDSEDHRHWVLGLSERLRTDGIDCQVDQYVAGSPSQGWPRWMLDELDHADFVVAICTDTYYQRFRGHQAPGMGAGVTWEGLVITQELYDAHGLNTRFIPVLVTPDQRDAIPEPLRAATHYVLDSETGYQTLLTRLHGLAGVTPGPVRPRPIGPGSTAAPLTFPGPAPTTTKTANHVGPPSDALQRWLDKRAFIQQELATATGTQKFALLKDLDEAEAWITKLRT